MRNNNIVLFIFLCSFLAIKADEMFSSIEEEILNIDIAESFDDNAAVRFVVVGNLDLFNSDDAQNGNILKDGIRFIHNFGTDSTFMGIRAGNFMKTRGFNNSGLGVNALRSKNATTNSNAQNNTAIGKDALTSNTDGTGNTAIGYMSLFSNTTGINNTAAGRGSLLLNTSGSGNSALGRDALMSNTIGSENTAVGYAALSKNTEGSRNTAVGVLALQNNTKGSDNTAIGRGALSLNSEGINNTAIGRSAMQNNQLGSDNVAIGSNSLLNGGKSNTAIGALTGQNMSASLANQNNLFIGYNAGFNMTTGNNNVYIGNMGFAGEVGIIRIGGQQHKRTFIAGIEGQDVTAGGLRVIVNQSGELGVIRSSRRFKHDISEIMNEDSASIHNLRPISFIYREDKEGLQQWGLIAEEVDEILPELVVRDVHDQPISVRYDILPVLLLKEMQKQKLSMANRQIIVEQHQKKIRTLKQIVAALQVKMRNY